MNEMRTKYIAVDESIAQNEKLVGALLQEQKNSFDMAVKDLEAFIADSGSEVKNRIEIVDKRLSMTEQGLLHYKSARERKVYF